MSRALNTLSIKSTSLDEMAQKLIAAHLPKIEGQYPCSTVRTTGLERGRRLLMTGGAGFLGVHLLDQLARSSEFERIFVIVRQPAKLMNQLRDYGIGVEVLAKVWIIEGDLCTLPKDDFPAVDVVLHSAARIHCIKTLPKLWEDNVAATDRILSLYAGRAQLHLVSTLSVFVSSNRQGAHPPNELPVSDDYLLHGGYAQSKYVCERLGTAAGAHIIRLGLLTGASTTGRFPPGDFFSTFLQALRDLKCFPAEYAEAEVDVTPVDFAAELIVRLLRKKPGLPLITHIANFEPVSLTQVLAALSLTVSPLPDFLAKLSRLPRMQQVLLKYAFFKQSSLVDMPEFFNVDLFQTTGHSYCIASPFSLSNHGLLSLYVSVAAS